MADISVFISAQPQSQSHAPLASKLHVARFKTSCKWIDFVATLERYPPTSLPPGQTLASYELDPESIHILWSPFKAPSAQSHAIKGTLEYILERLHLRPGDEVIHTVWRKKVIVKNARAVANLGSGTNKEAVEEAGRKASKDAASRSDGELDRTRTRNGGNSSRRPQPDNQPLPPAPAPRVAGDANRSLVHADAPQGELLGRLNEENRNPEEANVNDIVDEAGFRALNTLGAAPGDNIFVLDSNDLFESELADSQNGVEEGSEERLTGREGTSPTQARSRESPGASVDEESDLLPARREPGAVPDVQQSQPTRKRNESVERGFYADTRTIDVSEDDEEVLTGAGNDQIEIDDAVAAPPASSFTPMDRPGVSPRSGRLQADPPPRLSRNVPTTESAQTQSLGSASRNRKATTKQVQLDEERARATASKKRRLERIDEEQKVDNGEEHNDNGRPATHPKKGGDHISISSKESSISSESDQDDQDDDTSKVHLPAHNNAATKAKSTSQDHAPPVSKPHRNFIIANGRQIIRQPSLKTPYLAPLFGTPGALGLNRSSASQPMLRQPAEQIDRTQRQVDDDDNTQLTILGDHTVDQLREEAKLPAERDSRSSDREVAGENKVDGESDLEKPAKVAYVVSEDEMIIDNRGAGALLPIPELYGRTGLSGEETFRVETERLKAEEEANPRAARDRKRWEKEAPVETKAWRAPKSAQRRSKKAESIGKRGSPEDGVDDAGDDEQEKQALGSEESRETAGEAANTTTKRRVDSASGTSQQPAKKPLTTKSSPKSGRSEPEWLTKKRNGNDGNVSPAKGHRGPGRGQRPTGEETRDPDHAEPEDPSDDETSYAKAVADRDNDWEARERAAELLPDSQAPAARSRIRGTRRLEAAAGQGLPDDEFREIIGEVIDERMQGHGQDKVQDDSLEQEEEGIQDTAKEDNASEPEAEEEEPEADRRKSSKSQSRAKTPVATRNPDTKTHQDKPAPPKTTEKRKRDKLAVDKGEEKRRKRGHVPQPDEDVEEHNEGEAVDTAKTKRTTRSASVISKTPARPPTTSKPEPKTSRSKSGHPTISDNGMEAGHDVDEEDNKKKRKKLEQDQDEDDEEDRKKKKKPTYFLQRKDDDRNPTEEQKIARATKRASENPDAKRPKRDQKRK